MYDIIILGSGPAGLTAALYAGRAMLKTLVIAGAQAGGQLMLTTDVENFPGFENAILGPELMQRMRKQAERFGAQFIDNDATAVDFSSRPFKVMVDDEAYEGRVVIIATGAYAKWLGLESEQRLRGRGVSSCAPCLPPKSSIITNLNITSIGNIRKGDKVLTHLGSFEPITKVYKRRYDGPLVNLKARYMSHEELRLTPNHPVLATRLHRGTGNRYWNFKWEQPQWVPAGHLTKDHILLLPIVRKTVDRVYLSVSRILHLNVNARGRAYLERETYTAHRIPDRIPVNNSFMRFAGYFLADGCATGRGFRLDFGAREANYIQDAMKLVSRLFRIKPRVIRTQSLVRIQVFSKILGNLMGTLFGRYSYGKRVPEWFLFLPTRKQAQLIKGFWRGDGAKKKLGFVMITNSKKLVAQFGTMLFRLGIIPSISVQSAAWLNLRPSEIRGRTILFKHDRYCISLAGSSLHMASRVVGVPHERLIQRTRSHHYAWLRGGFAMLPIRSIAKGHYSGYVYNLAVRKAGSYVSPIGALHNCDGYFFRGKRVVVVGGGDGAMEEALVLTKFATHVTVIHRRDKLRASKILQERALKHEKIRFVWDSVVQEVLGKDRVEGVRLKNVKTGAESVVECDGVFVAIGHEPNTGLFRGQIELDQRGYIVTRDGTKTNVEGVFAAGDVHDYRYRQAVTAAGDGCRAAMDAERFLEEEAA